MARSRHRLKCFMAQSLVNRFWGKEEEATGPRALVERLLGGLRAHRLVPLEKATPQEEEPRAETGARFKQVPAATLHHITLTSASSMGQALGVRARLRAVGFDLARLVEKTTQGGDLGLITGVSEESGEGIADVRAATSPATVMVSRRFREKGVLDSWRLADKSAVRKVHKAWPAKRFAVSETAAP